MGQVARRADLGRNDTMYTTITHLGQILHPGDTALGYDMEHSNAVDPDLDRWLERGGSPPEVILVRAPFPPPPHLSPPPLPSLSPPSPFTPAIVHPLRHPAPAQVCGVHHCVQSHSSAAHRAPRTLDNVTDRVWKCRA